MAPDIDRLELHELLDLLETTTLRNSNPQISLHERKELHDTAIAVRNRINEIAGD